MKPVGAWLAPPRFLLFLAVLALATGAALPFGWPRAWMLGFDAAAAAFLLACFPLLRESSAGVAAHAAANDANRALLLVIALAVTAAVLAAVAAELAVAGSSRLLVIATLALAWAFANSVFALHYAHLYYSAKPPGGLGFTGDEPPDYSDFVYFAFTLGMTFQTSDTAVSRAMRPTVTIHSLAAFVFNIGVIAFTVNTLGK